MWKRLIVFAAMTAMVMAVSAVGVGADEKVIISPSNPAHINGVTVEIDTSLGDVTVTDAIFIANPGEDDTVQVQLDNGATVVLEVVTSDIDSSTRIIIPPGDDIVAGS